MWEFRSLHWRSIGPAVSGGRVAAVAGTDANPLLYYLGAAGGGVWRTSDGGATWKDVFSTEPVASIGALAIAPSNSNIVWVGTGESKPRNDAALGDGVWESRDGGATWLHRGLAATASIARILIDRRNPDVVLVGALGDPYRDSLDRGVYQTTDGGKTWRQTLYVGPQSGVSDMAWDARGGKLVFAGVWQIRRVPWNFSSGGSDDGLYRSRDGGVTWQRLSGHGLPGGIMGRIGVAVAPGNPRRIYALIQSQQGSLWRSDDTGDHWRLMSRDTYINQRPFYMSRLEVDPRNADHVFFLSEDLVETRNGGLSFFNNTTAVHQDHHAMWIASDGRRMIEGDDGGAPISLDGGAVWDQRYNVTIAQIYHLGFDRAVPYNVCGGMQDNDSYCGPSDSLSQLGILNHDWRDVGSDSDGAWTWPDPLDANLVWNVGIRDLNGQLTIYHKDSRQSYDVTPYVRDTNGMSIAGLPYRYNWEAPLAFSPIDPHVAYYGANVVFETRDRGRHWRQISPDLTLNDPAHLQVAGGPINTDASGAEFYDTILDIAPSPLDRNVIWVGTDDGLVQVTRDGGAHWKNVTMQPVPPYGRVETVEASSFSAAGAFAVVDRHFSGDRSPYLFATSDYGASWKLIASDLPSDEIMHVVRQDPRNAGILYAGSEHGVWISFNGGEHWLSLRNNMPTASVHDLRIQPQADDLIAATHGRGFWILDDLTPLQQLASATSAGIAFFQPRPAYTFFHWWTHEYGSGAGECCALQNQFAGENPSGGALLSYFLSQPARHKPTLTFEDASGRVLAHMDAPNGAGVNRVAWGLSEDPPVQWHSSRAWNQGPSEGPTVVPGVYKALLRVDGATLVRSITVLPDPRAHWTQAEYVEGRNFLGELYAQLSQIDVALNSLDLMEKRLSKRIAQLQLDNSGAAVDEIRKAEESLHEAQLISAEISSNPRNSEDNMWKPDKLRERLLILIDAYGHLSQGPPLEPHRREAAEIRPIFDAAISDYQRFVRTSYKI